MRLPFGYYLFAAVIAMVLSGCKRPDATPPHGAPPPVAPPVSPVEPVHRGPTGKLEGTARLKGSFTAPAPHPVASGMEKVCGTSVPDLSLEVKDELLEGALISVDDLPATPVAATDKVELDQSHCAYRPAIAAGHAGATLSVKNSDALLHNVRAGSANNTLFNLMMPLENTTIKQTLPAAGVVDLHCDVHPWMRAWVAVFSNDAFAISDAAGRYSIGTVPAGHHKIRAWHPRLGTLELEADVPADGSSTLDVVWDSSAIH